MISTHASVFTYICCMIASVATGKMGPHPLDARLRHAERISSTESERTPRLAESYEPLVTVP